MSKTWQLLQGIHSLCWGEKEIKECIIEINNEILPSFSYKYRFKNEGIYKIKYTFLDSSQESRVTQ